MCVCMCVFNTCFSGWLKKNEDINLIRFFLFARMDRIKARQQKYKKGKERMLSMNQESSEGPEIRKVSEEDDEGTISYSCTIVAVER